MAIVKQKSSQVIDTDERKRARDWPGLVAELEVDQPSARRWAARDLAEYPESSAPLVDRLKRETDFSVREAILTSLTKLGDQQAVAGLVDCLRSDDAALRNEVIEAMKQLPDEVAPIMNGLLNDADPDIRIFAVNILESLRHPHVENWLVEVIESDPHVNVCATAVDLLGEVGSALSQHALQQLKLRFPDEPYIGFACDLALKRIAED